MKYQRGELTFSYRLSSSICHFLGACSRITDPMQPQISVGPDYVFAVSRVAMLTAFKSSWTGAMYGLLAVIQNFSHSMYFIYQPPLRVVRTIWNFFVLKLKEDKPRAHSTPNLLTLKNVPRLKWTQAHISLSRGARKQKNIYFDTWNHLRKL